MYDLKCRDLALAFLEDSPAINTPEHASKLAQLIQDTIEEFVEQAEEKRQFDENETEVSK